MGACYVVLKLPISKLFLIPNLKASIEKVFASEAIILGPARQPGFDIHKLEEAWVEFEKART